MRLSVAIAVLGGVVLPCAVAAADDINPPTWRDQPGSTRQAWEFFDDNNTPAPDVDLNEFGVAELQVWPGVAQSWWQEWGGREGVWPLSGSIEIWIPNQPIQHPYKEIWIQLTWAQQAPGTSPIVYENGTTGVAIGATLVKDTQLESHTEQVPPSTETYWHHTTYSILLEPNPAWEIIRIDGAVMVDEVVIDTICYVPEPATLALLGTGLFALVLRRRRRK